MHLRDHALIYLATSSVSVIEELKRSTCGNWANEDWRRREAVVIQL